MVLIEIEMGHFIEIFCFFSVLHRHIACRNENTRIALYLLAHGASLDITNNADESPYDCIRDVNGACGRAILFNLQIRNITGLPERNIIHQ